MKTFRKKLLGKASAKKPLRKASSKAQSAMEYLMTYGWAILIIAVVLAALFQLGVFNPMTFAPKVPPGSCQVFRPNGPGTTSFINLEGVCSGELPQYVATFPGNLNNSQNTPATGWITASGSTAYSSFTVAAWIYYGGLVGPCCVRWEGLVGDYSASPLTSSPGFSLEGEGGGHEIFIVSGNSLYFPGYPPQFPVGQWEMVAAEYNGSTGYAAVYLNGQLFVSGTLATNLPLSTTTPYYIGDDAWQPGGLDTFNGSIANVQLYNTTLSANEIQALYLEGIGGAPINLQHLVAWWPLNGNANDYSGNAYNGQTHYNVKFVSNWYNGYTPP